MKVTYHSNNSGGYWWLNDQNWRDLEAAGWTVQWYKDSNDAVLKSMYKGGRFLGALASSASVEGKTLGEAIADWESATGAASNALGCNCCGAPHSFTFEDDNGKTEYWSPEEPLYGDRYDG